MGGKSNCFAFIFNIKYNGNSSIHTVVKPFSTSHILKSTV